MAEYDIRTLQKHILKILIEIDRVCKQHNITYYLADGSMLGAIRHRGFIPWDDDLDIMMPRPDYTRFMAHAAEWLSEPFEAVCAETDPRYPGPFGKVIDSSTTLIERMHIDYIAGLYVDVFPIDGISSNRIKQRVNLIRHAYYKRILYLIHRDPYKHGHGPSSWLPLLAQWIYSNKRAQESIRRVMTRYGYEESEITVNYDDGTRGVMPKRYYGKPTLVCFEGIEVMGVECPHEYLSNTYGSDYMTIPPIEKQRQHNFHYLDYHLPYRQYEDQRENMKRSKLRED